MAVFVKKSRGEAIVVAGLLGLGGLTLVALGLRKPAPTGLAPGGRYDELGVLAPLAAGEQISQPDIASIPTSAAISSGAPIVFLTPTIRYAGPGRNAYSYARVIQTQRSTLVTVYGSGVAGIFLQPSNVLQLNPLVPPQQPVGAQCPAQSLCAWIYPGPCSPCGPGGNYPTPICGAPPVEGPAWLVLEVYERSKPQDGDGYTSPTCGSPTVTVPRIPVARRIYKSFILTK